MTDEEEEKMPQSQLQSTSPPSPRDLKKQTDNLDKGREVVKEDKDKKEAILRFKKMSGGTPNADNRVLAHDKDREEQNKL